MLRALAAAAALAMAACSSGGSRSEQSRPIPCDLENPCPAGKYCQADVCVPPEQLVCIAEYPLCPEGYVCGISNTCVVPPPPLHVAITQPAASLSSNGTVHVVVSVTNGVASSVHLERNGAYLGAVVAGSYDWNTSAVSEGQYDLVAVATRGSESFTSAAVTVTVDRTAPYISSSTPANGAGDVLAGDPVQLVLSEAVRPGTLAGAVSVSSGGAPVASTASLRVDGRTVDVSFTPPATRPVTVSVAIGAPLADLAGNVAATSSISFTYPAWIPLGGNVYAGPEGGGLADLAVDDEARPVIAVVDLSKGKAVVRVSRLETGAWQALDTQVNAVGTDGASGSLAVDPAGRPVISYVENRYSLRVKRWNGSAWSALGGVLSGGTTSVGGSAVAFMADGEPVIAYGDYAGNPQPRIYVKRWDAGAGQWVALGDALNPDFTKPATSPSIAVDPQGRPVVAFEQWATVFEVHARRWENGAWAALGAKLAPSASAVYYPSVAIDGGGAPLVAVGNGGNGYVLRWDGSAWASLGGAICPMTTFGPLSADLAVDATGRALVAFDVNIGSGDRFYVSALDGGTWTEIAPSPSTPGVEPWGIALALDGSGIAFVGFCEQVTLSAGPPAQYEYRCWVRRESR